MYNKKWKLTKLTKEQFTLIAQTCRKDVRNAKAQTETGKGSQKQQEDFLVKFSSFSSSFGDGGEEVTDERKKAELHNSYYASVFYKRKVVQSNALIKNWVHHNSG